MTNNLEKNFMDNDRSDYYRFTSSEMLDQKDEIVVYILTRLTNPTEESIRESIREINALTGYNISMEAAMLIRRLANYLEYNKSDETTVSHTK